jgi:ubiquitin carboxyl-terminal hydrolase MINDY-1/2
MNVNPRFVPTPELITAHKRSSMHVHPSQRDDIIPGTFEDTRDMKLYATFSIPLIHGWLPPKDDPACEAFARQALSYDEAQNLMFREEELEDKLSNSSTGLTEQEQQIYQDILTIKSWLNSSATQLTKWGLEVITRSIQPGTFAILFRNDHFSTLYRHPQTHQLFTLVTDAGYYSHDEIVWESLVDINGERAEFFSGDFRLVGGPQQEPSQDIPGAWYTDDESTTQGGEWQTVQSRRGRNGESQPEPPVSPMSANHEQEDRDLALALQLQEEEDERHRSEQAARRRESQLSEQYIEQQGRGTTARTGPQRGRGGSSRGGLVSARGSSTSVNIPVRGGSTTARGGRPGQHVRPLVPPANTTHRPTNAEDDDAPPSYEQASKAEPYVPPTGHPNHPSSSPSSATSARRRQTLSGIGPGQQPQTQAGPSTPVGAGRGRPMPAHQHSASAGRDKDCLVM